MLTDHFGKKAKIEVNPHDRVLTRKELKEKVRGQDAVLCLLTDTIDKEILEAVGPKCKIFSNYAVGFNNIDIEEAAKRDILVTNTPGVLTDATSDMAATLLLSAARLLADADDFTRAGKFKGWGPMLYLGADVSGRTLGIIGAGRIGATLARKMAKGFGMKVLYTDLFKNQSLEQEIGARKVELKTLLQQSDFVSVHVNLTSQTKHMISKKEFKMMKESAVLINTARGPVVDEEALIEALKTKEIFAAGLDVFEDEPKLKPGLKNLPNVIVAPHIASATFETRSQMAEIAAKNLIDALEGKMPEFCVNQGLQFVPKVKSKKKITRTENRAARVRRKNLIDITDHVLKETTMSNLIGSKLQNRGGYVYLKDKCWDLESYENIYVLGLGKASAQMARTVEEIIGSDRITEGMVIVPEGSRKVPLSKVKTFYSTHPLPSKKGVNATRRLCRLAKKTTVKDLVLLLISGGGSALAPLPPDDVSIEDKIKTTKLLLRAGVNIRELNAVRKHLSQIKGGQLARLLHPANVLTLVVSDVMGNNPSVIASGPVSPDPSTFKEALSIIEKYNLVKKVPTNVLEHLEKGLKNTSLETPKADSPFFENINYEVLGDHDTVLQKAMEKGRELGYHVVPLTSRLFGEARVAGKNLAKLGKSFDKYRKTFSLKKILLVATGETTVTVKGKGSGGRNQEFVLASLPHLSENMSVLSLGTDGADGFNPELIAGALGDLETLKKAKKVRKNPKKFLDDNNSYEFFKAVDGHVKTGYTGTNLGDLVLIIIS